MTSNLQESKKRLQQLLAIPERVRTDPEWDEIIELEIQLAPGNRIDGGGVSLAGGGGGSGRQVPRKKQGDAQARPRRQGNNQNMAPAAAPESSGQPRPKRQANNNKPRRNKPGNKPGGNGGNNGGGNAANSASSGGAAPSAGSAPTGNGEGGEGSKAD